MTGALSYLTEPLRRHWPLPVARGLAFGWWVAAIHVNPVLVGLHGGAAARLATLHLMAAGLGLAVGGVLWTRWPGRARPAVTGALGAAAMLMVLLPLAPAAAWGGMYTGMGFLIGLWYPVWGAELFRKVSPGERGRVVGWAIAMAYASGQVSVWVQPWVNPALLALGHAALLAAAAAVPLRAGAPEGALAGPAALRPWWRLLLFALVAGPLVGVVRAVAAPTFASFGGPAYHLGLLIQGASSLLAGAIIDRRGRVPAVVIGTLILGLALSLQGVSAAVPARIFTGAGAWVGVPMLQVFWATILADLSGAYGPAGTYGFGHGIGLLMVGAGMWAGHLLPESVTRGAVLVAFALSGVLRILPETGLGAGAPGPGGAGLAAALSEAAIRPLSRREQQVALLLLRGFSTGEIAAGLFLSEYTVRTHLHHIYGKTRTGNRQELLARVLAQMADSGATVRPG